MTIPVQRGRDRSTVRHHARVARPTPWLDLLWMVPLTVVSYAVALVGGSWISGGAL